MTDTDIRHERHVRLSTPFACGYRDAYNGRTAALAGGEYAEGYASGEKDAKKRDAKQPIRVGTSWTNASGKTWTVFEVLPFGKIGIRSGYQFAEMHSRDVRRAIAKAKGAA